MPDRRIWPGSASCIRREVVGLTRPSTSKGLAPLAISSGALSQATTSPTWMPTRARSCVVRAASSSVRRPRWYASANATASIGRSNIIRKPSVLSISRPPCWCASVRARRSCRRKSSAARRSPRRSTSAVESARSHRTSVRSSGTGALRCACDSVAGACRIALIDARSGRCVSRSIGAVVRPRWLL